jgi:hypothetical protein
MARQKKKGDEKPDLDKLSPTARLVLSSVRQQNTLCECPDSETIREQMGLSDVAVKQGIAELRLLGYITPNNRDRTSPIVYLCRRDLLPKARLEKPAWYADPFGNRRISIDAKAILAFITSREWGPVTTFRDIMYHCHMSKIVVKDSLRELFGWECSRYVILKNEKKEKVWYVIGTKNPEQFPIDMIEECLPKYLTSMADHKNKTDEETENNMEMDRDE